MTFPVSNHIDFQTLGHLSLRNQESWNAYDTFFLDLGRKLSKNMGL